MNNGNNMGSKDRTGKRKTMNDIIAGDMKGKPVEKTMTTTETGLIAPGMDLVGADGKPILSDPREDEYIKKVLAYNESLDDIEKNYSIEEFTPDNGMILVRLYKRIPVRNNLLVGFQVRVTGAKQMKEEYVLDPYHFDIIGKVVNYDPEYKKKDFNFKYEVGDVVQVTKDSVQTVIEKHNPTPYVKGAFFTYNEERGLNETGYVQIRLNNIKGKVNNFDLESYTETAFKA